jgi:hydroxypyruvate reductase
MSKAVLTSLYRAALSGVAPARAVRRALSLREVARALSGARRVGVFAAGKAAASMLAGARRVEGPRLAVVPRGGPRPSAAAWTIEAAHPTPDASSVRAARKALAFFRSFGEGDVLLCLMSGGSSSLLCLPRPGLTLAAKKRAVLRLARRGADIRALNRLRTSLSAVKGGKLGRATGARLVTLVLSDVPGDRPSLVGSGPTVRRRKGDITLVVGWNGLGLRAAASRAAEEGLSPRILRRRLTGEASAAGARFARAALALPAGTALLAGGETTVRLKRRSGRGGRALEFALGAAGVLYGRRGVAVLCAGSDGKDGSSRAAGAFADGTTLARGARLGISAAAALSRHDTEPFLARLEDLLVTGPTGVNVADWAFAVRSKP